MADKRQPTKSMFRTESPYMKPEVQKLAQPHYDMISDTLINLLAPVGLYGASVRKVAGTKRSRKRKRKSTIQSQNEAGSAPPAVKNDLLVGFNNVTRQLESLSTMSGERLGVFNAHNTEPGKQKRRHVAAVFLLRAMDDLIYSHLPTLCYTASLAHPDLPPTRLVLLDPVVEKRMAEALGHSSRVSVLALLQGGDEDEDTKNLIECVRQHVPPADVPWLSAALQANWLGTKVDVQHVGVGKPARAANA